MPSALTYPGVYIEEVSSGVHTINGVATSVAAFVGFFKRGSMKKAIQVRSFLDFSREFGGLDAACEASYSIQSFFLNGGSTAWVVRTAAADSAIAAAISAKDTVTNAAGAILTATALSEGRWGNNLRLLVDYNTTDPSKTFNLTVVELVRNGTKLVPGTTELFRNLTIDSTQSNDAKAVVNDGSKLIQLDYDNSPTSAQRPAHSGTISKSLVASDVSGLAIGDTMTVSVNGGASLGAVTLAAPLPASLATLPGALAALIRAVAPAALSKVSVSLLGSASTQQYLQVNLGTEVTATANDVISFSGTLATKLGFADTAANVQQYVLGSAAATAAQVLPDGTAQTGADGNAPTAGDLAGDEVAKTGMHCLEDVDLFNILCIPDTMTLADSAAADLAAKAEQFCGARRAFYLLDVPQKDKVRDEVSEIVEWLDGNATLRHANAAVYYPRPQIADPLNDFRLRTVASSGIIAGLFARTDTERGVWKAPAGTSSTLLGVQAFEYKLTDGENGTLNPLAINCLRSFPAYGNVSWGARTLVGSDAQASEWKYIPVRRTALFLEESLYRGTQWVVFEPNDEPLWAQIRLNLGAFMQTLFRQGAFQGTTPKDAYFVKCDKDTTTQNDIDLGIVNIVVGFAPLKPAEFVVIQLQQIAGQISV